MRDWVGSVSGAGNRPFVLHSSFSYLLTDLFRTNFCDLGHISLVYVFFFICIIVIWGHRNVQSFIEYVLPTEYLSDMLINRLSTNGTGMKLLT